MTSLTHLLVGGAVAGKTAQTKLRPWIGLVLAFLVHFPFDAVPHNDYIYFYWNHWDFVYTSPVSLTLLGVGVLGLVVLGWKKKVRGWIWIGGALGALPDTLTGLSDMFGIGPTAFDRFHSWAHTTFDLGEFLYSTLGGGTILPKSSLENFAANFMAISQSGWGNLGWGIEVVGELLVLGAAVLVVRRLRSRGAK